jgi:hypothetical protein
MLRKIVFSWKNVFTIAPASLKLKVDESTLPHRLYEILKSDGFQSNPCRSGEKIGNPILLQAMIK